MIVECTDNEIYKEDLTLAKKYEVLEEGGGWFPSGRYVSTYKIQNDKGEIEEYSWFYFTEIYKQEENVEIKNNVFKRLNVFDYIRFALVVLQISLTIFTTYDLVIFLYIPIAIFITIALECY